MLLNFLTVAKIKKRVNSDEALIFFKKLLSFKLKILNFGFFLNLSLIWVKPVVGLSVYLILVFDLKFKK